MYKVIAIVTILCCNIIFSQNKLTIEGNFPKFPHSNYELKGCNGLQTFTIATAESKDNGKFTLSFPNVYKGVAHLYMNGAYQNLLILNNENIQLYWEDLTNKDGLQLTGSNEYDAFLKGMKIFQEAEAKVAGLNYLLPLYENDTLKQKWLSNELQVVVNSFPNYAKSLSDSLFIKQYIHTQALIGNMPKSVETYQWRIPMHIEEFEAIDFLKLKHSGLYKPVIEGYTNLVERFPINEVYPVLFKAIDKVLKELKEEPIIQQEICKMWLELLEKKSLFPAAEYLAMATLNQENCVLDEKSMERFEHYKVLAKNKIAPDIKLSNKKTLKQLKNRYKLVVFGASWCPSCQRDYSSLLEKYKNLKDKYDLEIIYISIDSDIKAFKSYYKEATFITFCDGKAWETQAAKDYHIFATPTYVLLDKDLKILEKIKSLEHLENWFTKK